MHITHLLLPSHTQFVESGVKDAKEVASTDRSEQHRTWMAMTRLASPLGKSKLDDDTSYNSSKIMALVNSSFDRAAPHEHWNKHQIDNAHSARLAQVQCSLKQGHFKHERIEAKKDNVESGGDKCKRPNVAQQVREQHQTAAVSGLVQFGKLVKARNMDDLKTELLHRGVANEAVPKSMTERKKMLQELESRRLVDEGMDESKASEQAKRFFKKQSSAPFKTTDD